MEIKQQGHWKIYSGRQIYLVLSVMGEISRGRHVCLLARLAEGHAEAVRSNLVVQHQFGKGLESNTTGNIIVWCVRQLHLRTKIKSGVPIRIYI
jgi:hypothetical protein